MRKKLKGFYPDLEKIIIEKFNIVNSNSPTNPVEYMVYDENGVPLNLSICLTEILTVSLPIKNLIDQLTIGQVYKARGIDYFNPHHLFYNDYCYSYSANITDIPLFYRRDLIFPNTSFCEITCNYSSIENQRAIYDCAVKPFLDYELKPNQHLAFSNNKVKTTNIFIATCYRLFFKWDSLQKNSLFWMYGAISVINIISIITYYFK